MGDTNASVVGITLPFIQQYFEPLKPAALIKEK
jgi:hypothetical protein